MGQPIDKITLKGFKSIRDLEDFPLRSLNILIGANGAGKSNFVSFFTFLREAVEGRLGVYVAKKGGADDHLFLGPRATKQIYAYLHFRPTGYEFSLEPTAPTIALYSQTSDSSLMEMRRRSDQSMSPWDRAHRESELKEQRRGPQNWARSSDSLRVDTRLDCLSFPRHQRYGRHASILLRARHRIPAS